MSAAEKAATDEQGVRESRQPEEIRRDIEQAREELGETVAAVAEKSDVKQQAKAKAEELKDQAGARAKELSYRAKVAAPDSAAEGLQQAQRLARENPLPLTFAGVFLAGLVFGRLLSR